VSKWLNVAEGRASEGLRLVLTAGVPGPWGEAAKAVFHVKGIDHVRIPQSGGRPNPDLVAWTGESNAPQAILGDEPGRSEWSSIIGLGERLAPDPPLIPADPETRAQMFGLIHALAGEGGFGWSRRLMLFTPLMTLPDGHPGRRSLGNMAARYGYSETSAAQAPARAAEIVGLLGRQWSRQREANRDYLVGEQLSALDLYWAAFAALLEPLPHALCPMPDGLRNAYDQGHPLIDEALDPALLEHRQRIYAEFLELPIDLGPGFDP